ncbi:hypothetical protein [Candidatus Methanarcanum hacksteinii]|uniref:hypothetical protein n=1 Tax=Candidatus Methanarcanum hacksteinii TaxID=2911857 RepID=UPI0037DC73A5
MITYSYTFSRDEIDTIVTKHPTYKSPFFNVANLKGSSSTGKSTLMNMIALAFWGYDDPNIQASLRNRVKYIYDSVKIQLDFNIEMTSRDGNTLKSHVIKKNNEDGTKSNVDIKVRICDANGNERPIFKEEFRQKYSLIYDIPDNPTKRIDESLKDIHNAQKKYLDKVCNLKKTAIDIQDAIRNSRDPTKIELYKRKISEQQESKANDESLLSTTNAVIDSLRRFYWASIISDNCFKLMDLEDKINGLKKQARIVKQTNKQQNAQYQTAVSNHTIKIGKLCESYNKSVIALDKLVQIGEIDNIKIDTWSRYHFSHTNLNIDNDIPYDFIQTAENLIPILKQLRDSNYSQQDNQKYGLLKSIMSILENYSDDNSQGIKILDKTTNTIYNELNKELKEIEERVSSFRIYDDALSCVTKCLEDAKAVHQSFINIPEKPRDEETPGTDEDLLEQKQKLQDKVDELLKSASKFDVYRDNLADVIEQSGDNPLLVPYVHLPIQLLNDSLIQLNEKANKLNDNITGPNGYDAKIRYLENILSDLQACKDHPLSRHQKRVDLLVKKISEIQSDLGKKNDILEKIIDRNNNLILKQDSTQDRYLKQVWNNLGKRFGQIRHMEHEYEIVEVDILQSKIITTTGKEFSINDMGTGESQSAYLMNLLRSKQKTCIIAMFDESENMDYELRQGILKKFKELYDEGHLILGLTASHHSGSNNASIVEEYK